MATELGQQAPPESPDRLGGGHGAANRASDELPSVHRACAVRRRVSCDRVRARRPPDPARPGVLDNVTVVSGISGGSLLAAMWASRPENFAGFDTSVTALVTTGLHWEIARRALAPRAVLADIASLTRAVAGKLLGGATVKHTRRGSRPGSRRAAFGRTRLSEVTRPGLATVISATDLATGNAVRFGSEVSSLSSIGDIADPVPGADAVAASVAFPDCRSMTDWEEIGRSQLARTFLNLSQLG